jgi:beta-lactamase superfamily II metal-dependent hydrolase
VANPTMTVRMYNVGFGDCFLLLIPGPERTAKILVDCGSHFLGAGPRPVAEVARQIVDDVTEDGRPRIDVVVATHRHQDHVSGFAAAVWAEVEVGEVWMPWTEDPEDAAAEAIRERQSGLAVAIQGAAETFPEAGIAEDDDDLELTRAFALNSLTNEKAMSTLHFGFAGRARRRFLSRLQDPLERLQDLPGVTVHVLGPSRDPEVIAKMQPPSKESFLRLVASGDLEADRSLPFDLDWSIPHEDFRADLDFIHLQPGGQVIGMLRKLNRDGVVLTAALLEDAVNNTSLMLAFEVGKSLLLFPGDSQWGTWEMLLGDARTKRLLGRTSFYKVGHHGSHNASPISYVQNLGADLRTAAISVKPVERWKHIPKPELVEALMERTGGHVIRMDQLPAQPVEQVTVRDDVSVDMTVEV